MRVAMLIITADDWGGARPATDNSIVCFKNGRITSVSAMVFMRDSERAAQLAHECGIESGLHLNFSLPYDGNIRSEKLVVSQARLAGFLEKNRFAQAFYNPFLRKDFEDTYRAQFDEYLRLYGGPPTHINGHRHKHLCSNVIIDGLIPRGTKVRRTFSFKWGEKHVLNLLYRRIIDAVVEKKYVCTDYFFGLMPVDRKDRLQRIINLSQKSTVELMAHPGKKEELEWLMSDECLSMISEASTGDFELLEQHEVKRRE